MSCFVAATVKAFFLECYLKQGFFFAENLCVGTGGTFHPFRNESIAYLCWWNSDMAVISVTEKNGYEEMANALRPFIIFNEMSDICTAKSGILVYGCVRETLELFLSFVIQLKRGLETLAKKKQ